MNLKGVFFTIGSIHVTYQYTSKPNIVIEKSELIITDNSISKGMNFEILKTECKTLLTKLLLPHH